MWYIFFHFVCIYIHTHGCVCVWNKNEGGHESMESLQLKDKLLLNEAIENVNATTFSVVVEI